MANPTRIRKRTQAIRRAPDGSAFQNCEKCGVSVPISLADMHECGTETKNAVKRFKGIDAKRRKIEEDLSYSDEPGSPFVFFMEDFLTYSKMGKFIDVYREGFETWKMMSDKEREPYEIKAEKVNAAYVERLYQEIDDSSEVDDEADSAMVGKFDWMYEYCDDSFRECESFNS